MAGCTPTRPINEWIGQWLCAVPVGADLASYRSYHLQHHKFTQQPEDPDLSLSAPFPITQGELHSQGDPRSHRANVCQTAAAAVPVAVPATGRRRAGVARKLCLQRPRQDGCVSCRERAAVRPVLARRRRHLVLVPSGSLAMATWLPLVTRIRNIAEHACTSDRRGPVQPRPHHARQPDRASADRTLLGELPRRASSLHVSAVLPAARSASAAAEKGLITRMEIKPGYLEMMRLATSSQQAGAWSNLAPLFAGRGRIALAIPGEGRSAAPASRSEFAVRRGPSSRSSPGKVRGEGEEIQAEVDASGRTRSAPRRPTAVPRKIPATATNDASASVERPVRPCPTEQPSAHRAARCPSARHRRPSAACGAASYSLPNESAASPAPSPGFRRTRRRRSTMPKFSVSPVDSITILQGVGDRRDESQRRHRRRIEIVGAEIAGGVPSGSDQQADDQAGRDLPPGRAGTARAKTQR